MKIWLVTWLSLASFVPVAFCVDPPSTKDFEVRGFLGVVVPSAATQVPTGDFRTILRVFPLSPAGTAGVVPGDYILAVDGKSTATMKDGLELVHALQGAPGSVVRLELKRIADGRTETLAVTRDKQMFGPGFPK